MTAATIHEFPTIPNVMTREEFHTRWDEIKKTYGTNKQTAGARFEQTVSEFFNDSSNRSWTQEQIAAEIGMAQSNVSQLLTFGGFLQFITAVINGNPALLKTPLTEYRFRVTFWNQTKEFAGNDRKRYQKTWELILAAEQDEAASQQDGAPKRMRPRDFGPLRNDLGKRFSDGKWHDASTIADDLEVTEEDLDACLNSKIKLTADAFPYEFQQKPYGKSKRYRIFKTDRQLSRWRALEELAPILEGLQEQATKNGVTISVPAVKRLAHDLKTLMKKWEDE